MLVLFHGEFWAVFRLPIALWGFVWVNVDKKKRRFCFFGFLAVRKATDGLNILNPTVWRCGRPWASVGNLVMTTNKVLKSPFSVDPC